MGDPMRSWGRPAAIVLSLALLAGCAAKQAYKSGEREMKRKNYDQAVLDYSKAVALAPGNTRFEVALARAKVGSSHEHFQKGKRYAEAGQLELAVAEYQQTLVLDPGHQFAANEMQRALKELAKRREVPSEMDQLKERARRKGLGPPKLDAKTNIPILLNFKEVKIGQIFESIGKAAGINFIFDDKTDLDKPMTIDIGNVTLEQALEILMLQTKNFYKPIDEYTLLVAPDMRQKRQEYEDQVIRTFFLSNGDTKQVVTLLRSLLQARQIAENTDLNSVTIKDTPDKVAIAERIIQANDKARGEILVDVELLEINRKVAQSLGIDLSSKSLSLTFGGGGQRVPLNNLDSLRQSGNWTIGVIPSVVLNFLKSDSDSRLIAKPQMRISEGQQAEILIGDRVPIPTTSFNTSQTVGGNIVPITSFTYQNVGITLQIEPRVHHNREVTLKLQVEFSQVTGGVESDSGGQPIIGTRQIQTVIRLRDGETNVLAGLIQRSLVDRLAGVPGLSDLPGLRRLFGNTVTDEAETDIIMTLTPRIVRLPDITEQDLATLWVGTEDNMRLSGPARNALDQSPFGRAEEPAAAPTTTPTEALIRKGGSLALISPSEEVRQERRNQPEATPESADAMPPGSPGLEAEPGVEEELEPEQPDEPQEEPPDEPEEDPAQKAKAPAVVRLVPSDPVFKVGDVVVLDVFIEGAHDVGSVPFHLRYNPTVLRYLPPASEGPFLGSDGTQVVFLASDTGGGGEVVVGMSRLGGAAGVSGSGNLATFQFEALAPGDAGFAFTGASVKDPQAHALAASFSAVPVRVEP